jgi:hypothetical protein
MATAAFVVGTAIERNSTGESSHNEATTTAVAMLAFAALDVREVVHQLDINKDGLAALAAIIGLLHAAAAVVAATMTSRAWHPDAGSHGTAGTMAW